MTTDKWTLADETKLQSILKRKTEIMARNREPVVAIAAKILEWVDDANIQLPDKLIESAQVIRSILEPFDESHRRLVV